jgi:hypothetical protein
MPMSGFVLRNPIMTIGGTSYVGQLTRAKLVPAVERQTGKTLDPAIIYQDVDSADWTLQLRGYQGWEGTDGICDFLHENHGLTLAAILTPRPGTGKKQAAFDFIAQSVDFGGDRGEWAIWEAEFGVLDQPDFTDVA